MFEKKESITVTDILIIVILVGSAFYYGAQAISPEEAQAVADTRFEKLANREILTDLHGECFDPYSGYRDYVAEDEVPLILSCVDAFMRGLE